VGELPEMMCLEIPEYEENPKMYLKRALQTEFKEPGCVVEVFGLYVFTEIMRYWFASLPI
jgi:hypothetical protein